MILTDLKVRDVRAPGREGDPTYAPGKRDRFVRSAGKIDLPQFALAV